MPPKKITKKARFAALEERLSAAQSAHAPSKFKHPQPHHSAVLDGPTPEQIATANTWEDIRAAIAAHYLVVPPASIEDAKRKTAQAIIDGVWSQDLENDATQGILATVSEVCAFALSAYYRNPVRANWCFMGDQIATKVAFWFGGVITVGQEMGLAYNHDFFPLTYHNAHAGLKRK